MKIEEILKDKDLMTIAEKACNNYRHLFTPEELNSCVINAVWSLNRFYNKDKAKPSTYLYKGVVIEVRKLLKSLNRLKAKNNTHLTNSTESKKNTFEQIDMLDEIYNCEDPQLMYDRFYNNYTLQEMSDKYGITRQGVRCRIEKNLKIMRNRLQNSV